MNNSKEVFIRPCKGKMCGFGYCTDCKYFFRTSRDDGYCKITGIERNYGDPCRIDKWTPIT